MVQDKIAALNALGPVELGTIGVLVVSLLLAVILSVVIKRRARGGQARSATPVKPRTRAEVMASRPANPGVAVDMQERLRRLTAGGDGAPGASVAAPARQAAFPAPVSVGTPLGPAPAIAERDDATRFFGDSADSADSADGSPDATRFFADPPAPSPSDDATRFFADATPDATPDATRFFADAATPDATTFFAADAGVGHAGPERNDDATRFFGAAEADAGIRRDGFSTPSATQVFSPDELKGPDSAREDHAGPPQSPLADTKGAMWDTQGGHAPVWDTGGLGRVRECLAAVAVPEVMALSVIDSAGRVLAGENDADLTGELRSLMAESGQGNTADIEQPVRLADESTGAILLLPTGANALLGALVRYADDPQATRQSLRVVAHDIGDAIRCAS